MFRQSDRPAREVVYIGAFQLFPSQRLLKKNDEAVKLGSRSFDILLALADRPGEVVSQKELIATVWPGVFVEDVSLRVHVAALRKALDCDGTRYLANVPGRGYCLVAATSRVVTKEADGSTPAIETVYPLPLPLAGIVGRDEDVRAICEKLLSKKFVTIVGPGGMGKTTVALSAAYSLLSEFLGAVCFVELSPLGSPQFLAATITSALGLPVQAQDPIPTLIAHLRSNRVLLILDSCEHLIAEAAVVAERLFRAAPDLYILATSREALRVEGEYIHPLHPLTSPPMYDKLTANEALAFSATQLFISRIASAGYGDRFSDEDVRMVGEMCRRLDGIALAIELAAGRAAAHGIGETAALLNSQFALLWPGRRTAPARQQTLNATLDWSYDLLSDAERAVLRRLSVFAGGFTLEAAQRIAGGGLGAEEVVRSVGGLLAKFFLSTATSDLTTRYRLLDTTRAYASRKLEEAGEREVERRNHALYFCELLRSTAANEIDAVGPAASATDLDDIRAALRWAFDEGGEALIGADIAAYSASLWLGRALLTECRAWMAKAAAACIDMNGASTQQQLRIQIAFASAELFTSGFTAETVAAWERTLERANALSDLQAQFLSYSALWAGEIRQAHYSDALKTAESCAALARGTSDPGSLAFGEWLLGHSKHHVARFDEAQDHLRRSLEIDTEAARFAYIRATGYDRHVDALSVMSNTLWILGYPDQARAWSERAVAEAQSLGIGISISLAMLWALLNSHLLEHDADVVEHSAVELLELSRAHAISSDSGFALCVMGLSQANRGQFGSGVRLVAEGLRMLASTQMEAFSALLHAHICEAALAADRLNDALFWMSELESTDHNQNHWCSSEILRVRGLLADAQGDRGAALECLSSAVALARQQGALAWELRSTVSLCTVFASQQRYAEALAALEAVYVRFDEGYDSSDLLKAKSLLDELRTRLDGR